MENKKLDNINIFYTSLTSVLIEHGGLLVKTSPSTWKVESSIVGGSRYFYPRAQRKKICCELSVVSGRASDQ